MCLTSLVFKWMVKVNQKRTCIKSNFKTVLYILWKLTGLKHCEEVSILWIFISAELSCKPSNSNNFTWLMQPSCHFWNIDSHWQYFASAQSQPALPSAHLLGCFVSTSTPVFPTALVWGTILSHSCPAHLCLCLTKMPASSYGCLAGYALFTSQTTCWRPGVTKWLINKMEPEPSSWRTPVAPRECRQRPHWDPAWWVTGGAAITLRQRRWQETSRRERRLANPLVCPTAACQIFSGLNISHRIFRAHQISML